MLEPTTDADPTEAADESAEGPSGRVTDDDRLKPGDRAPDFELASGSGRIVRLSWLRGQVVVLYFYLSDTSDECALQSTGFRDYYDEIQEMDAVVLGISNDGHVSHEKTKLELELPFSLLVDRDCAVAKEYGAWGERTQYGQSFEGVVRSHFVIDEGGKIVDAAYRVGPKESVERVMTVLRELE